MPRLPINPLILGSILERRGLTAEGLAQKLRWRAERVRQWLTGERRPTWQQLKKLAKALHVPVGYFFLSELPAQILPVADFRTLPEAKAEALSPDIEALLQDAMRKRDWLREHRREEGWSALPFIGRFTINDAPAQVAEHIRTELQLPLPFSREIKGYGDYLRRLIQHAEAAGIVVLRSRTSPHTPRKILSVEEFRGFTLVDPYAPIIFLNAADSLTGQIFTLAHELAHLWIQSEGISNPLPDESETSHPVERFCNRTAAELLMPAKAFQERWLRWRTLPLPERIERLSRRFKVSPLAAFVRARQLQLLSAEEAEMPLPTPTGPSSSQPAKKGGGGFYKTFLSRNSKSFVSAVLNAVRSGRLLYRDAARLLGTSHGIVARLLQKKLNV